MEKSIDKHDLKAYTLVELKIVNDSESGCKPLFLMLFTYTDVDAYRRQAGDCLSQPQVMRERGKHVKERGLRDQDRGVAAAHSRGPGRGDL